MSDSKTDRNTNLPTKQNPSLSRRDFLKFVGEMSLGFAFKDVKLDTDYSSFFSKSDLVKLVDRGEKTTFYKDYYSSFAIIEPLECDSDQFEKLSDLMGIEASSLINSKITWITQRVSPEFSNEYSSPSPDSETALVELWSGEKYVLYKFPGGNIVKQNLRELFDDYEMGDSFSIYQNGVLERYQQTEEQGMVRTIAVANWGQFEIVDKVQPPNPIDIWGKEHLIKHGTNASKGSDHIRTLDHKLLRCINENRSTKVEVVSALSQSTHEFSPPFYVSGEGGNQFFFSSGNLVGSFKLENPKPDNQKTKLIFSVKSDNQSSEIVLNLDRDQLRMKSLNAPNCIIWSGTNFVGDENAENYAFPENTIPNGIIFIRADMSKSDIDSPNLPWIFISTDRNGQVVLSENVDTANYINEFDFPESEPDWNFPQSI